MKILVTGCCGFIGRHVWALLRAHGHELIGIDALVPQVHGADPVPTVTEGLIYADSVGNVATGGPARGPNAWDVDAVIHLAAEVGVGQSAYEPARYVQANVLETAQLWERLIEAKTRTGRLSRVVVASSMSVYGEGAYWHRREGQSAWLTHGIRRATARGWDAFDGPDDLPLGGEVVRELTDENKIPEPASVYALSKLDTERYSLLLGDAYGIPTTALRLFNVYGDGQSLSNAYTGFLATCACRVLNGKPPLLYEDGQQSRDFVHVDDVARAVVTAVEVPALSGVFNVATGVPTTVADLAERWCRIVAERGLPRVEPEIVGKYRVGDVRHCVGDPAKFSAATGWRAEVTLDAGLLAVADWILANHFDVNVPADHSGDAVRELRAHGLER